MSLRNDIKPYLDPNGLVTVNPYKTPDDSTGNGVLYLSEFVTICELTGEIDIVDDLDSDYHAAIQRCMPVAYGLLHRSPTHQDQIGPDDYIGMFVGAWATRKPYLAEATITYALSHFGFLNNEVPGTYRKRDGRFNWSAFLVRQPQLIAAAYWAADKKAPIFTTLWTAATIALAGFRTDLGNTDSRILAWMLSRMAREKSWLCKKATKVFERRLLRDYENGMKDIFTKYFNKEHPLAKYVPKV